MGYAFCTKKAQIHKCSLRPLEPAECYDSNLHYFNSNLASPSAVLDFAWMVLSTESSDFFFLFAEWTQGRGSK